MGFRANAADQPEPLLRVRHGSSHGVRGGPNEYLFFLEMIQDTCVNEVEFRNKLREKLNSIIFQFINEPLPVKCNIWSMPYRYSALRQRIEKKGIAEILVELTEVADHNFGIIEYIQLGHKYEAEGSLEKADDFYGLAGDTDPNNVYIWRHRAKIHSRLRNYNDAVRWWLQVVTVQEHPKHFLHLAYNRACLGEIPMAEEEYKQALAFD